MTPIDLNSAGTPRADAPAGGGLEPNWYSALSRAWGRALDGQALRVARMARNLNAESTVGDALRVTAEAHVMSVMASSASTVNSSIGQALETLGRR